MVWYSAAFREPIRNWRQEPPDLRLAKLQGEVMLRGNTEVSLPFLLVLEKMGLGRKNSAYAQEQVSRRSKAQRLSR